MSRFALTVTCPSTRGIIAAIANYMADSGCNITDSSQYDDLETGQFFMRVSFTSQQGKSLDELKAGFGETAKKFSMNFDFHDESRKMKVIIMVSRFGHCLNDLLYRWRIGALNAKEERRLKRFYRGLPREADGSARYRHEFCWAFLSWEKADP